MKMKKGIIRFPSTGEVRRMVRSKPKHHKNRHDPFGDRDKDGAPNFADCAPANPKRQGPIHTYLEKKMEKKEGFVARVVKGYGEFKEAGRVAAKEARVRKLQRLKEEAEIEKARTTKEQYRISRAKQRAEARKYEEMHRPPRRSHDMSASSMFGTGAPPSEPESYFGKTKKVVKPIKKKKKKKKTKAIKSIKAKHVIIGGKAYPVG